MIKLKKIGLVIVASIFMFAAFAVCGCNLEVKNNE